MSANKMTYKERQAHAKEMSAFAHEYLVEGLDTWPGEEDMIKMVRGDAKDYRKIATLLRTKSCQAAYALAQSLDTAARDCIPQDIWDAMDEDLFAHEVSPEDDDEITRKHIAHLTGQKESLERQIEKAKERLNG